MKLYFALKTFKEDIAYLNVIFPFWAERTKPKMLYESSLSQGWYLTTRRLGPIHWTIIWYGYQVAILYGRDPSDEDSMLHWLRRPRPKAFDQNVTQVRHVSLVIFDVILLWRQTGCAIDQVHGHGQEHRLRYSFATRDAFT